MTLNKFSSIFFEIKKKKKRNVWLHIVRSHCCYRQGTNNASSMVLLVFHRPLLWCRMSQEKGCRKKFLSSLAWFFLKDKGVLNQMYPEKTENMCLRMFILIFKILCKPAVVA